jgi:hypothetical protein
MLLIVFTPQAYDALIGHKAAGGKTGNIGMETAGAQTEGDAGGHEHPTSKQKGRHRPSV